MGSGVQEEDSSSQSDNLHLVRAGRTGTAGELIELQISDGSCFFVSGEDLQEEGITVLELLPGLELSPAVVKHLQQRSLRRRSAEKALDLLSRAPHSVFSLRSKLLRRGFDSRIVGEVLESLSDQGYLNDRTYAENWLRSRSERRPEGRAVMIAGLLRKGVAREIAEEAVNRYYTPELERENAVRALEKLKRSGETDPVRLKAKLRARGFPYPLIRRVVEGED
jgi:regulatory protein